MNSLPYESSREDIINILQTLKFTGMLESYDEIIAETIRRNATLNYALHNLLKSELKTRMLKSIQTRMYTKLPRRVVEVIRNNGLEIVALSKKLCKFQNRLYIKI